MNLGGPARHCAAALALSVSLTPHATAQEDEPFRTRNLSPLISIFGLPVWVTPGSDTRVAFTSELANHYRFSRRGEETLVLDGETWRSALSLRRGFGDGWIAGLEVPYYQQTGGFLDDLIDSWHSAFDMPDGGRNRRGENDLVFLLADEAGPFFALDRRARGLGDVQISLGRTIGADDGFLLQGTLKLPTGDEDVLAGSGSADASVTLLRSQRLSVWSRPAAFFWGVGATAFGDADRVEFDTRDAVVVGMLGGGLKPWPKLGLKAQLDFHGALYDSRLRELGDPGVQVTIGGWRDFGERVVLELAINEDLAVSTSPDLVLHLALEWSF